MADVVLVTDAPEFGMVEGMLEVTLASGPERHIFRISKHKARNAIMAATVMLDADDRKPSNVRRFARKKRGHNA